MDAILDVIKKTGAEAVSTAYCYNYHQSSSYIILLIAMLVQTSMIIC